MGATNKAVPTGWKLVPIEPTVEMVVAIEQKIDEQLNASGMFPGDMQRQDGADIYEHLIAAAPSQPAAVSAPSDEDELLALVPEREIMKLWGMCAYWGSVDTRVVPFARAVIRSARAAGAARAAAPVSDLGTILAEQKADVKLRDGDWWRGYESALHWIAKEISDKNEG